MDQEEAYNIEETEITCDDALRNVFDEKASFPLTRHEVQDIQHAVEIMILFLLTSIYEQTRFNDLVYSNKKIIKTLTSIKHPHRIHETFRTENLLKVGSYYENTKNCYPDEFDFICVIADCDVEDYIAMNGITSIVSDIFHFCLHDVIQSGLKFPAGSCLEFDKYVRLHGPAASLKFKYRCLNNSSKCRSIFVDLSPACQVSIRNELPEEMRIPYPEWKDVILETGSFLILKYFKGGHPKKGTKTKISIIESEKLYMQNKMSEEHKRVYRLLKFIFHGNLSDEDLKRHIRDRKFQRQLRLGEESKIVYDVPSYIIKTLMFHHCHTCKRNVETIDTECIVAALKFFIALFPNKKRIRLLCIDFIFRYRISISVLTMTGEYIEVADCYRSSIEIAEVLKKFVRAITDTADLSKQQETGPQTITDLIPIANDLQAIAKRERLRPRQRLIILIIALISTSICFVVLCLTTNQRHESKHCFLGQGSVDGFILAEHDNLTSNFSQSSQADIVRNISKYFLCLDRLFSSVEAVAKIRGLYFCGYEQSCTADRCYKLKTGEDGHDQGTFCDSYTFSDNGNEAMFSAKNITSMENSARRVVCVWDFKPCLRESIENSDGSFLLRDDSTCFDSEKGHDLHSVIQERNLMDCNASKLENDTLNKGLICCCNSYPCSYPETEPETHLSSIRVDPVVFAPLWVGMCMLVCVCVWVGVCGFIFSYICFAPRRDFKQETGFDFKKLKT